MLRNWVSKIDDIWFWITNDKTPAQNILIMIVFAAIVILPFIIIQYILFGNGDVPQGHWTIAAVIGGVGLWFVFVIFMSNDRSMQKIKKLQQRLDDVLDRFEQDQT